jgi:hypothetical protein
VIAIYRVRAEKLDEFLRLLEKHHPTLVRLGLATKEPPTVYRGAERDKKPIVFEIFTWVDGQAPETAHHSPEVMKIWEAMGAMVEERGGIPKFEFPHVERVQLARQRS